MSTGIDQMSENGYYQGRGHNGIQSNTDRTAHKRKNILCTETKLKLDKVFQSLKILKSNLHPYYWTNILVSDILSMAQFYLLRSLISYY